MLSIFTLTPNILMKTDKQVADILFKGGDIITLDENNPYIRNGAIAVAGKEIAAVGPASGVETENRRRAAYRGFYRSDHDARFD